MQKLIENVLNLNKHEIIKDMDELGVICIDFSDLVTFNLCYNFVYR